jgi:glucokinase
MTIILAADIGGTKTLLQLSDYSNGQYQLLCERRYVSQDYASFDSVLSAFLNDAGHMPIDQACFAIAGPIAGHGANAKVTNLPWVLDAKQLSSTYAISNVRLINDFHAVAVAIDSLPDDDIMTLQQGQPQTHEPQLVIGAGTGLGVALRIWDGHRYQILASEAGHAGFSPANGQQRQLLEFVTAQHPLVSRELLLSGSGLKNIYQFLCQQQQLTASDIDAAQISQLASQGDPACQATLALFFSIYGSECANLALLALPFGGIYIAGGIAAKNIDALTRSGFVTAFCNNNKMGALLSDIPIYVIKNQSAGLLGARWQASHPDQD